jgi:hypothetical protein
MKVFPTAIPTTRDVVFQKQHSPHYPPRSHVPSKSYIHLNGLHPPASHNSLRRRIRTFHAASSPSCLYHSCHIHIHHA